MIELNPIHEKDSILVKKCNKCTEVYELGMFNKCSIKKSGVRGECKLCQSKTRHKYASVNYDSEKEYFRKSLPKYNLAKTQYDNMYSEQKGRCKICNKHESEFARRLHIDHCHLTNKVRGLLCNHCNKILGYVNDDLVYLEKIKQYLIHAEAK